MTKLKELLDAIDTVKALLAEAEALAGTTEVNAESLAQIAIRKARLDVSCEIATSFEAGTLDEPRRQRFEQFLTGMTHEALLRSLDICLLKAN